MAFQKYKVGNTNDYIHALWIVENSYPTLTVDETLSLVGVTKEAFDTRIKALYGNSVNLEEYEDMVLFSIIQYAVWKSVGTNVAGEKLGGEITNAAEFNTIYKYYIDEGKVPANYNTPSSYSSKIDFVAPAKGKEKYDKHQDAKIDFYGPFSATYTAIYDSSMKINYAIDNNDKKAVKLYTADFKEITGTTVDKDQVFFIGVANNQEIKNVKINFTKTGITTFYPVENRGKIYSPIMGISQNVLVGGRAAQKNITGTITMDIVGNPKTGIQNIALLLLVTLIAFTLGYMVLSYKQKPIQLQQ